MTHMRPQITVSILLVGCALLWGCTTVTAPQPTIAPTATTVEEAVAPAPEPTATAIVEEEAEPKEAPAEASRPPNTLSYPINLPPGFGIELYAADIPNARAMALSPSGMLFVGSRSAGTLYAVIDIDQDYQADRVVVLENRLNMPTGLAFDDGSLYVAEVNRVVRYDNIEAEVQKLPDGQLLPNPEIVNDTFPSERWHGWKYLRMGPDNKLYVPVGVPCNVCDNGDPYGTIMRMNLDGSDLEVYVRGVRNSVGFDFDPTTNDLWFTDNGRDEMGDDLPPDELNHVTEAGQHFGFPFCHGGSVPEPEYPERSCDEFIAPAQPLGPHVAALGMRFYTGDMFPEEYRNQIFIAEHGSWNRTVPIGYRVMMVRLDDAGDVISYEPFADGWLADQTLGRPADLLVMPDGSMLVSDDAAGAIYRIYYNN